MRIMYNERQAQWPSKLQTLRVLHKREALEPNQTKELEMLERRETKIKFIVDLLEKHSEEEWNWGVVKDYSLGLSTNSLQCHLILVTDSRTYFFQINDDIYDPEHDAIHNAQEVYTSYTEFFNKVNVPLNLHGAALMPDNLYEQLSKEKEGDIHVLSTKSLEKYIIDIIEYEKNYTEKPLDKQNVHHWLNDIDWHSGYQNIFIRDNMIWKLRRGIMCEKCDSFDCIVDELNVTCSCGHVESLEEAVIRTALEYTAINNDNDLTLSELSLYFEEQIPDKKLRQYLEKHFWSMSYGRHRMS